MIYARGAWSSRAPRSRRRSWLAICFVLLALLPNLTGIQATHHNPPTWLGSELDTRLIHAGLVRAPHFQDTLRWWIGPWVAGNYVPFYRPLTSDVFWLEWKCFGDQEWLYIFPTIASHALACVLLTWLVYRLAGIYGIARPGVAALTAAWLFTGLSGPMLNRTGVADMVMRLWKNQPDSLAAACCFAALLCYLKAQEGSRSSLYRAVFLYLAACSFKEIAIPLPVVCLCLEWQSARLRPSPGGRRRIFTLLSAALIFLVMRRLALAGAIGYTYGQNGAWVLRTVLELLGPFYPLALGEWLGNAIALWIGWMVWLVARLKRVRGPEAEAVEQAGSLWRRWLPIPAGLVTLIGIGIMGTASMRPEERGSWQEWLHPTGIVSGWMMAFQPVILATVVTSLLLMAAIALLLPKFRAALFLGFCWGAAFLAPLVLSGGPVHRYYLPQVGFILIYAFGAAVGWEKLSEPRFSRLDD